MNLTAEQETLGRRNFLKALAGVPAVAALGAAAATRGPLKGGRVKVAWLGVGGQGRALLQRHDPAFVEVRALSIALLLVGLSLLLGLFTQAGCVGALLLLSTFYMSQIPTHGLHETGNEGAYLFVNKNLVEAAAVVTLLAFRTGRIAGLDLLRRGPRDERPRVEEAA